MTGVIMVNARQRMIESAAQLMRERGVEATSFSDVIEHSGAPRGSIYHHFPGGKAQLVEEATRWAGAYIGRGIAASHEHGDPLDALEAMANFWRQVLGSSEFAAGCPVVAGTVEGDRTPGAREAAGEVFAGWQELISDNLVEHGVEPERAASLAAILLGATEGAVILCRAERSMEPFERTISELRTLLSDALAERARV
jgi:TetR/AcrR family transcriptional regulator, lmrAB and yxaGH operons repressor